MKISVFASLPLLLLASNLHATLVNVGNENEYNELVLKCDKPCVIKFAADWCGVCQGVKKPYEELSEEEDLSHVQFVHVNIDEAQDLTKKQGVVGVPTFIYVTQGEKVGEEVGVQDMDTFKDTMRANLDKHFQNTEIKQQSEQAAEPERSPIQEVKDEGIFEKIISLLKQFINFVIGLIKYMVDAIKGLFTK